MVRHKENLKRSLGMPETSLRGRNTLTALRVLRSTEMFMWAPAAARILNVENTNPHKQKTETESRIVTWMPIINQHSVGGWLQHPNTDCDGVKISNAKNTKNNIRFLVFWLFPCMRVWEDGCDKRYLGGEQRIGPSGVVGRIPWSDARLTKNTSYRHGSFIGYTKTGFFTKFSLVLSPPPSPLCMYTSPLWPSGLRMMGEEHSSWWSLPLFPR